MFEAVSLTGQYGDESGRDTDAWGSQPACERGTAPAPPRGRARRFVPARRADARRPGGSGSSGAAAGALRRFGDSRFRVPGPALAPALSEYGSRLRFAVTPDGARLI